MKPEVIAQEIIYNGRVFDVRIDTLYQDGRKNEREIVQHKGSAVIVPFFDDNTVAFVRQYRHPAGRSLLEFPAGGLDNDESPEQGAARELEEEVGVTATSITKIAEFYVSPGFLTEKMHVYLATGLTHTAQNLDEDEVIEIERVEFGQALDMAKSGEIEDAKTIIGILLSAPRLGFAV